jgi:hypothetical protein
MLVTQNIEWLDDSEKLIGKNVEENGFSISKGTVSEFA